VAPHCILALKTTSTIAGRLFHSLLSLLRLLLAALLVRGLGAMENEPLDVGKGWVHEAFTGFNKRFMCFFKYGFKGIYANFIGKHICF
jgi:hypothetical protein